MERRENMEQEGSAEHMGRAERGRRRKKPGAARGFARVPDSLGEHVGFDQLLEAFAEGEALVANTSIHGIELAYEDAGEATFDTVLFRSCQFEGVDFSGCTFRDVRFESCRFVRCSMERAWLNRCDFAACSAPGINMLHARLAAVGFWDTDLSFANLSETSIDQMRVASSRLREAALQSARLKRCEFVQSDLIRLDVFRTPLKGIDVSTCDFAAPVLSSDYRELRGAVVSPSQALELAGLLGVVVADE